MKLISIIVVTFNAEKTFRSAIESVIPHLGEDVELIVIDGNSTDSTVSIIREYERYISYWVTEPDNGIYDAWNKALRVARGEYLTFLGADDVLLETYSEVYLPFIKKYPNYEYLCSKIIVNNKSQLIVGKDFFWKQFSRRMTLAHPGSLHKASLYLKFGVYDASYKIAGDYDFLLRCGPTLKVKFFDVTTVKMGAEGISNSRFFISHLEARKAKLKNKSASQIISNFDFIVAIIKSFVNYFISLRFCK